MPRYIVECLAPQPEPMTIVSKDGTAKAWNSLRALQRHDFVDIKELLTTARYDGQPVQRIVRAFDGSPRLIEIVPIIGPAGDAHGMHLWIGPDSQEPSPRQPANGMSWHLDNLQVHVTETWWRMWRGPDGAEGAPLTLSPGEFFRNAVRFDHIEDLVVSATDPSGATTHLSYAVVLHDLGHLMNWYNVARCRTDDQHTGMRGLAIDVTDTTPPVINPSEVLGLTAATSSAHADSWTGAPPQDDDAAAGALFASSPSIAMPIIAEWITRVPRWIDWEREGDPQIFHPDDYPALRATFTTLTGTEEAATPARIRGFTASGWQPVTVTSRRYPGDIGDRLHIIRIAKTAN